MIKRPIVIPELLPANVGIPRYFIIPEDNEFPVYTSYLGTSYYTHLELAIPNNNDPNSLENDPNNIGDSIIFRSCLVTIRQNKNIVYTSIQGRNGTIKEYIALGDYEITIEGMIVCEDINAPISFPENEVNTFNKVVTYSSDANDNNLNIISPLVNKFCSRVVVSEFELREIQGTRNALEFTIQCVSDDNPLIYDTTTT